jgi:polyferredoxin
MSALLADVVLVVHFLFVAFVVGGLALVWIGAAAGWRWVRNLWFRAAHLAAIVFVAGEALLGIWCPLTIWEDALRNVHEEKSFIARWIHRVLFYDFPGWVFTVAYVTFALVVAATWYFVRPVRKSQAPVP